jgi:hypothetical protein
MVLQYLSYESIFLMQVLKEDNTGQGKGALRGCV